MAATPAGPGATSLSQQHDARFLGRHGRIRVACEACVNTRRLSVEETREPTV